MSRRDVWNDKLDTQRAAGLWRTFRVRTGPQSTQMNFNSNDYLGMSNHPQVIQAFKDAADQYGVGSGSAQTLSGYTAAHEALRDALREWLGREDVLLFSSGYQANLALMTTLMGPSDHIYADKLNHASLIDGMLFSKAKFTRYPHLNFNRHCEKGTPDDAIQKWIITESIFSMNGDAIDLPSLIDISHKIDATLIVDEAHSLGLYGPQGSGFITENGFGQREVPLMVGTFGKSIGTQGAFIAGDKVYIDALMQFARPFLFTTAMAPALAAASTAAIKLIREADEVREHIFNLVHIFRNHAKSLNLTLADSQSPIQPILFDDIEQVNQISELLNQQGVGISSIRYPTVPLDEPRLRVSLTANHTPEMVHQFFEILEEALHEKASHASCL